MNNDGKVHCVVVTPEKTELDTVCDSLVLPLFDGELGIQPGRAPMVGRLGFGILKIRTGTSVVEWFVDGGFVQVTRDGVNILTDSLVKPGGGVLARDIPDILRDRARALNLPRGLIMQITNATYTGATCLGL